MAKKTVNIDLLSDQAIKTRDHDKFNRWTFVDAIAEIIQSQTTKVNPTSNPIYKDIEENMIIGLYGSWGVGKSSIINLLDENLKERRIETIYFNPWMYNSEETLINSLFSTIINHSGLKGDSQQEVIKLLKTLQPLISTYSNSASKIIDILSNETKEEVNAYYCKQKIEQILLGKANPLVIFIDDVDRLSKDEIHVVFKCLRLLASFKHIVYVIALDFDMVSKSIKEKYVGGNIEDGKAFIEKIIQIPIRIPELKPGELLDLSCNLLKETTQIDMKGNPVFKKIIENYFHTPRDIKRFINGFRFTHNYLKDKLKPEDLVILELIRIKIHDLFEIIKIYYNASISLDPQSNYKINLSTYLREKRPEAFKTNNEFIAGDKEITLFNYFFCEIFNTTGIQELFYDFKGNTKTFEQIQQTLLETKDISNPKILAEYFNHIPNTDDL